MINYYSKDPHLKLLAHSELDVKFAIAENPGLNVDSTYIEFGMIRPNGLSRKNMTIYPFEEPVLVDIRASEEIKDYIIVNKNSFIFYPTNESIELEFTLDGADNLSFGNYTGQIYIDYYEVKD